MAVLFDAKTLIAAAAVVGGDDGNGDDVVAAAAAVPIGDVDDGGDDCIAVEYFALESLIQRMHNVVVHILSLCFVQHFA